MAKVINRSASVAQAETPAMKIPSNGGGDTMNLPQSPGASPLKIFVLAKKKINDIFNEICIYVGETVQFLDGLPRETEILNSKEISDVKAFQQKITGVREVLQRDHMKVAFFGRTSNGKSTVINAMLHDKVLPSGIGHTTNCFVQVEGDINDECFLTKEGSDERINIKNVTNLASALNIEECLSFESRITMHWPMETCPLLRDGVVLVDSPGVDVSEDLDKWIDGHCMDADVFVLVANAESTLMRTEKHFFHKVSEKLSKPNIFILNNRWDASAGEAEFCDQVRSQHIERCIDFLATELGVSTKQEARDRIFFVSAKEALQKRLIERGKLTANSGWLAEGYQKRYFEFQDFEQKFEECISKSAVKTKFTHHTYGGKRISSDVRCMLDIVSERAQKVRVERGVSCKELSDKLDYTEKQLQILTSEVKHKISHMVERVEGKVSSALSEEIRRLASLVDEFNAPFHPDMLVLNVYKRELHAHVESGLGSNLRFRLSSSVNMEVERAQKDMIERMGQVLPGGYDQVSSVLGRTGQPFEVLYRLHCDNLCADFKENLSFKFTLGLTTIASKIFGRSQAFFSSKKQEPDVLECGGVGQTSNFLAQDDISLVSRFAVAALSSQGAMGGMLAAGFLLKSVGWRLVAVTGGLYGALYLYERMTWTNNAKERAFKEQYVEHARKKLRLIVDLTSANCSHQVQQELSSTFARLCHLVDNSTTEMRAQILQLDKDISVLEQISSSSKKLKNKATYINNQLELFEEAYLKSE